MSNFRLEDEFISRTKKNLDFVTEHASSHPGEVYEITQFMNSLLGLLVFPRQWFLDDIPELTLDELERAGWKVPKIDYWEQREQNLKQLVRCLRNSVSHAGISFESSTAEIEFINFVNINRDRKVFSCRFGVPEFKEFIRRLVAEMEKIAEEVKS